jgi:glycosidase
VPESFAASHYGYRFEEICDFLQQDLAGHMILIGAGLFGKIYCDLAARHGGVALDLGSMFDVLSGHDTRPVFSRYNFEGRRWINA